MTAVRCCFNVAFLGILLPASSRCSCCANGHRVHHRTRHRRERRHAAGSHGHRHQPGDQRHACRRHQRGGQLHHHAGDGRRLRDQGRAAGFPDVDDRVDCSSRRGRSRASTSRWASARLPRPCEVAGVVADPADGNHRGRRGALGQHGAVAAAQRPQHRPAGAAPARHRHLQPARLHQHRQHQHEPPVRQRQPRADQQLHGRRTRRQRDHRQPRRLSAQSRRARGDQRRDQQLRAPMSATSAAP